MRRYTITSIFFISGILTVFPFSSGYSQKEQCPVYLLAPDFKRGSLLMQALKERKSTREFKTDDLPLDILSNLLWAACGINRPDKKMITVPSGHNIQGIEVYVAMKSGLYLYNRYDHVLEPIHGKDIRRFVSKHDFVRQAPVSLVFVANTEKMTGTFKRTEKIEFSIGISEVGFISQNVYLFCASERLATVVIGWIDRKNLAQEMNLPKHRVITLIQPVGYPAE